MDIETSYNFRRITDRLTTSGVVRREGLKALASQGYEVVINLLPDSSEYALANERDIVESQGIEYVHIPVDFQLPTESDFEKFAETLDRVRGKRVHVHCAANYRVSAFYARYAVQRGEWDAAQASQFIGGVWKPEEHPGWPEFIAVGLAQDAP